jgi:glycosyltransferase involved in cell wall biosynthesis
MRVGQNPAKSIDQVTEPARVTAAVISYIPFLGGYYAQGLDILELCLTSLRQHADMAFDLMVFDNASCIEVRRFLHSEQEQGHIQYLILSDRNVGKGGAWNTIFGAAPGEYIAYADSDVYFFPDWLSPQVEVLETFPQAGMVTGMPILTPIQYSTATVDWAGEQKDVQLEHGQLIAWEDFWRHASTLGGDEGQARAFYEENDAYAVVRGDEKYFIGSSHFQFVARKSALQQILPIPFTRPMGQVRRLDEIINEKGYLRLATEKWYVRHLGNTLPEDITDQPQDFGPAMRKQPSRKGLSELKPVQKFLQWVHNWSFDILYRR